VNILLSFLAGLGLFLIVIGFLDNYFGLRNKQTGKLAGFDSTDHSPNPRQSISVRKALENLLYQAQAPISIAEFLFTCLGLGVLLAFAIYLVSGAVFVSIITFFAGVLLYYAHLMNRREKLARTYEEAQPQVIYTLYFYLKSYGLDFSGAIKNVGEAGPEIARPDWQAVAAAFSQADIDVESLNRLLTYRGSPSFTRIVEALLLFRGENIHELPRVLEDLRRDISQEVEISRESAVAIFGAKRQLMLVAMMPVALALVFILMMPSFKEFYSSAIGQILLVGMWLFSAGVYALGARAAAKASSVRPYAIRLAESRSPSVYLPVMDEQGFGPFSGFYTSQDNSTGDEHLFNEGTESW